MGRSPGGRHTASRAPRATLAARVRQALLLGAVCALVAAGLAFGLNRMQAVRAASAAGHAPQAAGTTPSILSQDRGVQPVPRRRGRPRRQAVVAHPPRRPRNRARAQTPAPAPTPAPVPTTAPPATPTLAPAAVPALAPAPTAQNQTPTGTNELAWSVAILEALGDPLTTANIESMGYWMQNEAGSPPYGIVGANNPINVSEPGYGGTPIKDEGHGYHLYSYPTVQDGIAALVAYLNPYGYPGILAALKAGQGLSSPSLAGEFSVYSGHGYSAVPDAWGRSQGKPLT